MGEAAERLFRAAVADHRAGRIDAADKACRDLLEIDPGQPDALFLLGTIRLQRGRWREAGDLLGAAARLRPSDPGVLSNLGVAQMEAGNLDGAIATLRHAVEIAPRHADALVNLGNAQRRAGRIADAEAAFRRACDAAPGHPLALNGLGVALALRGAHEAALPVLEAAVRAAPGFADASNNLGRTLQALGRRDDAVRHYRQALELEPNGVEALCNLGALLEDAGDFAAAEEHYRHALAKAPGYAPAHLNLGNLHRRRGDADAALSAYRDALAADPDYAEAHNNLGNLLADLRRFDESLAAFDRALALRPGSAPTLGNRGKALRAAGRLDEAIATYDRALALEGDHADARFGRALARLLAGQFDAGWGDYLARDSMTGAAGRYHRSPLARDLAGQRILVERDQGIGDEIFFLRYVGELRRRGAFVACRPDPRLAGMIARSALVDAVLGAGDPGEGLDLRLAVGDLPHVLGRVPDGPCPPSIRLAPEAGRDAEAAVRLAECGPPPYVGLTWRAGTPGRERSLFKEVPIDRLAASVAAARGTLVALQRLPGPGEVEAFGRAAGRPVADLTALNDDLESMLAIMGRIDDYIAVSNANVHLRAARGRTSRVLVPHPPEFRWLASGDESPWFPGSRLYRQTILGDWAPALGALRRDLAA